MIKSVPPVPKSTPSSITTVPGSIERVLPAGTVTSPVTRTTPRQIVSPSRRPETWVTSWPARLTMERESVSSAMEAVNSTSPAAPAKVTNAVPSPLRNGIDSGDRVMPG